MEHEQARHLINLFQCRLDELPLEFLTDWAITYEGVRPRRFKPYALCLNKYHIRHAENCNNILSECRNMTHKNNQTCFNRIKTMTRLETLNSKPSHFPSKKQNEWSQRQSCMKKVFTRMKTCLPALTDLCLESSIRATKLIRLRMSAARHILEQDPDVVIIYYTKDPRALLLSQYSAAEAKQHAEELCTQMRYDIAFYQHLSETYPDRVYHFRYEDIVDDYKDTIQTLYEFIGADLPERVLDFYHDAVGGGGTTKMRVSKLSTYRKNATRTAYKWKWKLSLKHIKFIESECADVLRYLQHPLFK